MMSLWTLPGYILFPESRDGVVQTVLNLAVEEVSWEKASILQEEVVSQDGDDDDDSRVTDDPR